MRHQSPGTGITIAVLIYVMAVMGYAFYGWETGTGLSGILMEYQMRFFGSASLMFTLLILLVVATIPAVVLGILVGSRMKIDAEAASSPSTPMATSSKWLIALAISVIVGLVPGAIYLWLERVDAADQQRTVYQMNFRQPGPLAADAKFAEISGYRVLKQQFRFSSSSSGGSKSTKVFVPLVDASWTPDKPVVYFYTGSISRMPDPLPVHLEAKSIPVFARTKFEQAGVKVADQHYLLSDTNISGGKVVSKMGDYMILPWVGVFLGFTTLLFSGVVIIGQAKAARKAAAASFAH